MSSDSGNGSDSGASTVLLDPPAHYVQFKVKDENGVTKSYRIKKWTTMKKLKTRHAAELGLPLGSLWFYLKGRLIANGDTALTLGLENNDIIDVIQE